MKVAILTTFQDFVPGYSLTGIVSDQIRMLQEHGDEVDVIVSTHFNRKTSSLGLTPKELLPFAHLVDYKSVNDLTPEHKMIINETKGMLETELKNYDIVFTHDFVFVGWHLPYAQAVKAASPNLPNLGWLHWIHSVPTAMSDWWMIKEYGPNHKLVYPNEADSVQVAEQYRGWKDDVRVVPHIKDLRTFFDFGKETNDFIKDHPAVMQADCVQIYPASVDRLSAKQVQVVMTIFSNFKRLGRSVCLVIANQWATGKQQREDVEPYIESCRDLHLIPGHELIFTSKWKEDTKLARENEKYKAPYGIGIPKQMLRELMQCSNLFIFPTIEETFGLVLPEAVLAGGVLPVLNRSLSMMYEIAGNKALYFEFGSFSHTHKIENPAQYFDSVAKVILSRMNQDESIKVKTFMRQRYNWDMLYRKVYAPLMAEMVHIARNISRRDPHIHPLPGGGIQLGGPQKENLKKKEYPPSWPDETGELQDIPLPKAVNPEKMERPREWPEPPITDRFIPSDAALEIRKTEKISDSRVPTTEVRIPDEQGGQHVITREDVGEAFFGKLSTNVRDSEVKEYLQTLVEKKPDQSAPEADGIDFEPIED